MMVVNHLIDHGQNTELALANETLNIGSVVKLDFNNVIDFKILSFILYIN